jgi:hypothetical protein
VRQLSPTGDKILSGYYMRQVGKLDEDQRAQLARLASAERREPWPHGRGDDSLCRQIGPGVPLGTPEWAICLSSRLALESAVSHGWPFFTCPDT